ncbi:MAG: hypothetical protein COC17_02790 [Hyphomicrobiales bacterium]|nr:MAG: hypothetical protein COC17_02790 [Hyphomicrobiales bacterium]
MSGNTSKFADAFIEKMRSYSYTADLAQTDWAWEYLRRNPNYKAAYYESRTKPVRSITHASGVKIYHDHGDNNQSVKWGLAMFSSPDINALESDIFWSHCTLTHRVCAVSTCANPCLVSDLDLFRDKNCCAILCRKKCQKAIIRSQSSTVDMQVAGVNILFQPVQLQFQIDGFATINEDIKALIGMRNALKSMRSGDKKPLTETTKLYRKKCLIALVCVQQGGSLRDTAFVFQALNLTRLSWSTSGDEALKKQVWRCRNMGLKLMQGGYRKLL